MDTKKMIKKMIEGYKERGFEFIESTYVKGIPSAHIFAISNHDPEEPCRVSYNDTEPCLDPTVDFVQSLKTKDAVKELFEEKYKKVEITESPSQLQLYDDAINVLVFVKGKKKLEKILN